MVEYTLKEVINELEDVRGSQDDTTDAVGELSESFNGFTKLMNRKFDQDSLNNEEQKKENNKLPESGKSIPTEKKIANETGLSTFSQILKGSFFGNLLAAITKNLIHPLKWLGGILTGTIFVKIFTNINKFFIKPLLSIGKFFLKTGPLTVAIGSLYALFHDIGNNPQWNNLINDTKNVWKNKVIPTMGRLFDAMKDIFKSSLPIMGIFNSDSISKNWAIFTNFFANEFKPYIQDKLIKNIRGAFSAIGWTMDLLDRVLNGDIVEGIMSWNVSLVNSVDAWIKDTKEIIKKLWGDITNYTKTMIEGAIVKANLEIDKTIASIENIYSGITENFEFLVNYIKDIPDRVMNYLWSIIPDWMKPDNSEMNAFREYNKLRMRDPDKKYGEPFALDFKYNHIKELRKRQEKDANKLFDILGIDPNEILPPKINTDVTQDAPKALRLESNSSQALNIKRDELISEKDLMNYILQTTNVDNSNRSQTNVQSYSFGGGVSESFSGRFDNLE